MWKTVVAVVALVAATLWLPVWVQVGLYIVAIVFVPYRLLFFIPAAVGDALYAPADIFVLRHHYYVLFVAGLLVIQWIIVHKTRLGEFDMRSQA